MNTENPRKKKLLATGKELFWKFGFRRVSVEEICKEAGISKVTFYKFFKNKTDLFGRIMDELVSTTMKEYNRIMEKEIPFINKVEQIIELKLRTADSLSMELVKDMYSGKFPELNRYIQRLANENFKQIRNDFKEAQKKGEINNQQSLDFIMYLLNNLLNIMQDDQFISLFRNSNEMIREITGFYFHGIVGPPKS